MKITDLKDVLINAGCENAGFKDTWRKDINDFVEEKDKIPGYWNTNFREEFKKRIFKDPDHLGLRSKVLFRTLIRTIKKDRGIK